MIEFWRDDRGAIYIFSVVLIAAMLVVLVGSLVALERATSTNILNREEELSYFQLESVNAMENKIKSLMSLEPDGDNLRSEMDRTISLLREQAEQRGMWQNISYRIDFEPSSLDLSPRKVTFDVSTKSREKIAYDRKEVYLNDLFVNDGYLYVRNDKMDLRFKIRSGSDEKSGYIEGGATYLGSDVVLASSILTDYLNMSSWTNATSVYSYSVVEQPGLLTIRMENETTKMKLTKFLYVKLDEIQFQINFEPRVSNYQAISYGIGLTTNINGPENDKFRIDNLTGGQLNTLASWENTTLANQSLTVDRINSWVVTYDDTPQPYALALILDEAETITFSSGTFDQCILLTPKRRGRFIVNGIIRVYPTILDAITDMRELKKLGKPPLGRANYLEPLVLALTIDDITFDPPAPKVNQRVRMIGAIENYGTKDAYDVVVHFYDGAPQPDRSNLLGTTNITSIVNGQTEVCFTTWTFPESGVHEIYTVIDPDNLLTEDHTDNMKHAPLKIYPQDAPYHDMAVEALHISTGSPADGETVSVSALVHNNGNREETDVVVRLQVIDDLNVSRNISSITVPNIPIDYYISVPLSFVYASGDETVKMTVDPVFNETYLENNQREAHMGSSSILIVADDNIGPRDGLPGSTSAGEFLYALNDSSKYHVTLWSEQNRSEPTLKVLLFFDAVVWTCGDFDGQDVETGDTETLVEFIQQGGHLLLEGEDIAYRHHQNATGSPDNFLWNVTKSYIDSYYNASLFSYRPLDDIEFDGLTADTVPQINTGPTHPVMANLPTYLASNYTASYPDAILPINSTELAVYESPDPSFLVLEDDIRSGLFSWSSAPEVVATPVLSAAAAFRSTGNSYFQYTFPYAVGDDVDEYRFIDLWFYFADANADILLQVRDGFDSWNHRWGWDVESSYNGFPNTPRQGTTLNCPWGSWIHYRLDLVTDLGLSPGTQVRGIAFSSLNGDVYFDHIRLARLDSWKSSMIAHEDFGTGSKIAYFAYPVSVVENRTRKVLIRNAIDWLSGRTLNRPPLITLTRPSGGEIWVGSSNITWSGSDPDGDALTVKLSYSQNDGITWIDLARGLPAVGYWAWDTTTVPDGTYMVRATADDSVLTKTDDSSSFRIDNINDPPTVTVTRPNVRMRLEGTEQILWAASDPESDPLTYDIEWFDGSTWFIIESGYTPPIPANPSYDWNTRTIPDGIDYFIRIRATDGENTVEDLSDHGFSVDNNNQEPSIQIISPNGGEIWSGIRTITWSMNDPDGLPAPIGDIFRDKLTVTVDCNSSDSIFTGSYNTDTSGFFQNWLLLGGFSGNNIDNDYMGGETASLPWEGMENNDERWWKHADSDSRIDLYSLMNPKSTVTGYAFAYAYNPTDRDVKMKVGSDDGVKVYLNGVMVHRNNVWRGAAPDQDVIPVHLNQGWNTVLVKVVQGGGGWAFYFRFTDLSDVPITDIMIALDKPNNFDTGLAYATGARLGSVTDLVTLNWDTASFPNGNYSITASVEDGRGGSDSDSSDSEFEIVNNRAPVVDVIYPNGQEILFGNVTVVWNATDPDGDLMTFKLYYKQDSWGWNLIDTITNSSWRWYLWDVSGLPDSPPEYYIKIEALDGRGGTGWDVSDDGWFINNADGLFGPGGPGDYDDYEEPGGQIGGAGTPPGWGSGSGGGASGGGSSANEPADRRSIVMLLTPLGGEEWRGTETIDWIHADFGAGLKFDVLVSKDSGSTWATLASGITGTTYSWDTLNFPGHADSSDYRIQIDAYDDEGNIDSDSSSNFMVYNNQLPSVRVTSPNGGEVWKGTQVITWTASDGDGDGDNDPATLYVLTHDVYYSDNSGSTWTQIAWDLTTTTMNWDTTTVPDGDRYRIRVVSKDGNIKGSTRYDTSNSNFRIDNNNEAPSVNVNSPNGGEKIKGTVQIRWTATDPDADALSFYLYYSDDAGATWSLIQEDFSPPGGPTFTYDWDTTTLPDGSLYLIRVEGRDPGGLQDSDISNSIFVIDNTAPTVSFTKPNYPPTPVVKGTVTLEGRASDTGGSDLDRVEIWVRGIFEGYATLLTGNRWQFDVDTTVLPEDQTVTVEARAYDGAGNMATEIIQMLIDNVGN